MVPPLRLQALDVEMSGPNREVRSRLTISTVQFHLEADVL
jgi:hypothetical protein